MKSLLGLIFVFGVTWCSPIRNEAFKEIEYEIPLKSRSYFIKRNEMPVYEKQFAKIRELGEEINCKITGSCQGMKRGEISKKSMLDEGLPNGGGDIQFEGGDMMGANAFGNMGGEDVSAAMMDGKSSFTGGQKDAASFGQQPQMDIKMSSNEMAAASAGMGQFSNPMGPMGGSQPDPSGASAGPQMSNGNDALLKLREQQNAQVIDSSVQDKLNFMDKANGPSGGPGGMGMPGVSDPLSAFPHAAEGKDDTPDNAPGGVTEHDLMKAEDIQPNEMKGISSFLKDSNHVERQAGPSMISDSPSDDGKTNVDFGGSQASIDNDGGSEGGPEGAENNGPLPMPEAAPNGPLSPGGPEVPTLNNLGLGMNPSDLGPPGAMPNFGFIQDNTRHMIQQNSDYKVPQSALSNLWNSYMSSTQSLLGEKDPSANSRQSIFRPVTKSKLHRRSNVEEPKKASIINQKSNKNFVYVPSFVIKNVLNQVKKTLKSMPKSKPSSLHNKKKEPALFIAEKKGKRYLVINPDSPLIQGFANVDNQFASFSMPVLNSGGGSMFNMNGFPSFQLPIANLPSAPFGTPRSPFAGMNLNGFPFLGGQADSSGIFRGFVAVPIATRIPFSPSGFGPPRTPFNFGDHFGGPISPEVHSDFFHSPSYDGGYEGGEEGDSNERTTLENYHGQNIHLGDSDFYGSDDRRPSSEMFGGYFGANFEKPSPFFGERSDFEQPPFLGARSGFERSPSPYDNDMRISEGNDQNYKRSGDSHPHPYVFTKEHVGFGPITVEAHTASYKGEDPKDDE